MTSMIITLPVSVPSKKNNKRIFTNRSTGKPFITSSAAHKKWWSDTVLILRALRNAEIGYGNSFSNCSIAITFNDSCKRKYDLTNKAESLMDAMVDAGILEDDNRFCVTKMILEADNDLPSSQDCVVITINGEVTKNG